MYTFGGMLTSKENELFAEFFTWVGDIDSAIVAYGTNSRYYELSCDRNFTHSYPNGSTIKLFKTDQTSVLPEIKTLAEPAAAGDTVLRLMNEGREIKVGDFIGIRTELSYEEHEVIKVEYVTVETANLTAANKKENFVDVTLRTPITVNVTGEAHIEQISTVVPPPPPPTPEDGGLSPGAIAGIVCGGVAGLALLTFAFVRLARTQSTKSPYETLDYSSL